MANFPAVTPTALDFTAPEFPVKSNTSLSGVVSRRIFGNRGSRSVLSLSFDNLTDAVATEFLSAWNGARGQLDTLAIPADVFPVHRYPIKKIFIRYKDAGTHPRIPERTFPRTVHRQ